jgi:AbiU2
MAESPSGRDYNAPPSLRKIVSRPTTRPRICHHGTRKKPAMTTTGIIATKEDAEAFCGSCVPLRALWEHYRTLFEGSDKRRELLETTAPIFFRDLNLMFIEQLVQRICRLTDNAQTMGRKNLTIKFMIEYTDFTTAPCTKDKLLALSDSIHRFRDKIKVARDRFISHLDLEAVRLDQPPGAASDDEWKQFWLDLQDFLNLLLRHHGDSGHFYLNAVGGMSDADSLVAALQNAKLFHAVLEDHAITTRAMRAADTSPFAGEL